MIIKEISLIEKLKTININNKIYTIINTYNNNLTLQVFMNECKFFIHSKYNPIKESKNFAETNYTNETSNILLYGLGLGYHIISILEKLNNNQTLYILECNMKIVKLAFENTDIKNYINNKKIIFLASDDINDSISFVQKAISKRDVSIIIHEPSLRIMPNELLELKELLEGFNLKVKSFRKFENLLNDNYEYNTKQNYINGGKLFKDKFKDIPCITVSAGPSLEININEIKKAYGKAIIIAVGRTAHFLEKNDIKPNFYIVTASQISIVHQMNLNDSSVPLFFLATANKDIKNYSGQKYMLYEKYSVSEEEKNISIETGGSVATAALSLSVLMGCNPIILTGQDLCYWSELEHSGEDKKYIKLKTNKYIEGINGEEYYTSKNLYEYLKWIERFISKNPNKTFINCTAKGANIKGAKNDSLENILNSMPYIKENL